MLRIKNEQFKALNEKELDELVDADGQLIGDEPNGDIGVSNNTEISTNPLKLKHAEKSIPTTGDDVRRTMRQPIPFPYNVWAGKMNRVTAVQENKNVITKNKVEEVIEDLVSKDENDGELKPKDFNNKLTKILKLIDDNLSDEQLERIAKKIVAQMDKPKTIK